MKNQKMKVLIVDDDERVHDFLSPALNENGYSTTSCHSAGEASTKLKNEAFDLLLIDINMPKRSGLDLVLEMRHEGTAPHLAEKPIIVMSGYIDEHEDSLKHFNSINYIEKPFNTETLCQLITKTIEEQSLRSDPNIEENLLEADAVICDVDTIPTDALYIQKGRVQVYDKNNDFIKEVVEGNFLLVNNAITKTPVGFKIITVGEVSIFKIPTSKIAEEVLKNKKWLQNLLISGFSHYNNLK